MMFMRGKGVAMTDVWCGVCGGENPTCPNCHPHVALDGYIPFARYAERDGHILTRWQRRRQRIRQFLMRFMSREG